MNNLKLIRTSAGVSRKTISRLLNVSVHTYAGFETGRMTLPREIEIMLSNIFMIEVDDLEIDADLLIEKYSSSLFYLSNLSEDEKKKLMIKNLFGREEKATYHTIRLLKNKIREDLKESKNL